MMTGDVTMPIDVAPVEIAQQRTVPLPASLVELLKARHKKADPQQRWIFTNAEGNPEGHFLRKLKVIALRAGLNCGHCTSETEDMTKAQHGEAFNKKFGSGKELTKHPCCALCKNASLAFICLKE